MDATAIHARLQARFDAAVGDCTVAAKDPSIAVVAASIRDVGVFLRDDPDLRFEVLMNQTGVDYKAKGLIQIVYHLYSYTHRHTIVVKVDVPRDAAVAPSVERVWRAAEWLEREIYDLLGVTFEDHPDLRRLLMPEDWIGYPLRKDFVEPEEYHGISTRRESLLR